MYLYEGNLHLQQPRLETLSFGESDGDEKEVATITLKALLYLYYATYHDDLIFYPSTNYCVSEEGVSLFECVYVTTTSVVFLATCVSLPFLSKKR